VRNPFPHRRSDCSCPGFDLPRWLSPLSALLNRFRIDQGRCSVNATTWGQSNDSLCRCRQPQVRTHTANKCSITKMDGGIGALHTTDNDAVVRLDSQRKRQRGRERDRANTRESYTGRVIIIRILSFHRHNTANIFTNTADIMTEFIENSPLIHFLYLQIYILKYGCPVSDRFA